MTRGQREDRDAALLADIADAAACIRDYVRGQTMVDFIGSRMMRDAVVHQLIVIGEASKSLTDSTKAKYPRIEWKLIARMRDKLAHHYRDIEVEKVWKYAAENIPELIEMLELPGSEG
jgi:uncharacterized protein with HEPN domain